MVERLVANGGEARADADRQFGERGNIATAGDRLDRESVRRLLDDVDRRAADRAGRAEENEPALRIQGHTNKPSAALGAPRTTPSSATNRAAAMKPSSRSMTPP